MDGRVGGIFYFQRVAGVLKQVDPNLNELRHICEDAGHGVSGGQDHFKINAAQTGLDQSNSFRKGIRHVYPFFPSGVASSQQANGTDNGCSVPDSQFHVMQVVPQFPIREVLFQLAEEWLVQQLRLILYVRNQGQGLGHVLGKPVIFSNWRASLRCSEVDAEEAPSNPLLYRV